MVLVYNKKDKSNNYILLYIWGVYIKMKLQEFMIVHAYAQPIIILITLRIKAVGYSW